MMTAVDYLKEKRRMTNECNISCDVCPMFRGNNDKELSCGELEEKYPGEAVFIVQKWAEEHPMKTMLQDFFEKYPNAPRKKTGEPLICPETLGYRPESTGCHVECYDCWNRPLEE